MRTSTFILAAATLAASATAQVQLNEFGYYPDSVTFATRVFIPNANAGDVTVRVDQGTARGVGGARGTGPSRLPRAPAGAPGIPGGAHCEVGHS